MGFNEACLARHFVVRTIVALGACHQASPSACALGTRKFIGLIIKQKLAKGFKLSTEVLKKLGILYGDGVNHMNLVQNRTHLCSFLHL